MTDIRFDFVPLEAFLELRDAVQNVLDSPAGGTFTDLDLKVITAGGAEVWGINRTTGGSRVPPSIWHRTIDQLERATGDRVLVVFGDSVANENDEWVRLALDGNGGLVNLSQKTLAERFPTHAIKLKTYDKAADQFPAGWTDIQPATGGPTLYVYNFSVAGAPSEYFSGRRLAALKALAPTVDAWIVAMGHNDRVPGTDGSNPTRGAGNFRAVLELVRNEWPDAEPAGVGQNPQTAPHNATDIAGQDATVALYRDICRRCGIPWIDYHSEFLDDPRGAVALTDPDGTHPNDDGEKLMAEMFLQALRHDPKSADQTMAPAGIRSAVENGARNGDWRDFDGISSHLPTGWSTIDGGLILTRDTDHTHFDATRGHTWALKVQTDPVVNPASSYLQQQLDVERYRGKWVTVAFWYFIPPAFDANPAFGRMRLTTSADVNPLAQPDLKTTYRPDGRHLTIVSRYVPLDAPDLYVTVYGGFGADVNNAGVVDPNFYVTLDRIVVAEGREPRDMITALRPVGRDARHDGITCVPRRGAGTTFQLVANEIRLMRFVPEEDILITRIPWGTTAAATGDAEHDIGIFVPDPANVANLLRLVRRGPSLGYLNGGVGLRAGGSITIAATQLYRNVVYYLAHSMGDAAGTAATLAAWTVSQAIMSQYFGSASPDCDVLIKASGHVQGVGLPAAITSPAVPSAATGPYAVARP